MFQFNLIRQIQKFLVTQLESKVEECANKTFYDYYVTELTVFSDEMLRYYSEFKILAVDTETTGLQLFTSKVRLLQIAIEEIKTVLIFDLFKLDEKSIQNINKLFTNDKKVILHNAKFDIPMLWDSAIDITTATIFDTMIASGVIYNGMTHVRHSLKAVTENAFGFEISKEQQASDWSAKQLSKEQIEYAARDVMILFPLREHLVTHIKDAGLVKTTVLENQFVKVLAAIEYNGIYINMKEWEANIPAFEQDLEDRLQEVYSHFTKVYVYNDIYGERKFSLNISSPSQLLPALQDLGLEIDSTSSTALKTMRTDHDIKDSLLTYRQLAKALNTYWKPMKEFVNPISGRVHPSYKQLMRTGRISSRYPNILAIPRDSKYRSPIQGQGNNMLWDCDLPSIEVRIAAYLSGDKNLISTFKEKKDPYIVVASALIDSTYEEFLELPKTDFKKYRTNAKAVVLGFIYGMGVLRFLSYSKATFGLSLTEEEANSYRETFFRLFPELRRWHKRCTKDLENMVYLYNKNNRRVIEPNGVNYNFAINFGDQSLGADMIKEAQVIIFENLRRKYNTLPLRGKTPIWQTMFVHDQVDFEMLDANDTSTQEDLLMFETVLEKTCEKHLENTVPVPCIGTGVIAKNLAEAH